MLQFLSNCWPGGRAVWRDGSFVGLAAAIGFAVLLNLAIISFFIWSEWLSPTVRVVVCFCGIALWMGCVPPWRIWRHRPDGKSIVDGANPRHLFQALQREYLRGNWFQAEKLLERLHNGESQPLPVKLLCGAILRRLGRGEEALRLLELCEQDDEAIKWNHELARERLALGNLVPTSHREPAADPPTVTTQIVGHAINTSEAA